MIDKIYNCYLEANGISIDTRKIQTGELFFALTGPNFNGNEYAAKALESGASYAIVDQKGYAKGEKTILVDDVLATLQEVATMHRAQQKIPFIGLTGSNGKTTTKELMQRVLAKKYTTYATPGNLNNHIGVPLTILRMPEDTEVALIELGANHLGEISRLCEICQPTHGLITNVGKDHLEGFGSFEGSLRANSELYNYLIETDGGVFVNSEDEILRNMARRIKDPVMYPGGDDFSRTKFLDASPFVRYINHDFQEVTTRLIGDYNFANIAAAICVGRFFKVPTAEMDEAIVGYQPSNNRSQWIETEHNQLLMDAYNANPSSMEAAISNFAAMDGTSKVVIVGDMFELGSYSEEEHRAVGTLLSNYPFEGVYLVGEDMVYAHEACPGSRYFKSKEKLVAYLEQHPIRNAQILLKASRGIGLETLLPML